MSARNVDSLDRRLTEVLNDLSSRVRRVERRRPTGTGSGICDCEDGAPGADGRDGIDGVDGADGTNGVDGADGTDGADGAPGPPGPPGGGLSYLFSTSTTVGDPTDGYVRFDGVPGVATKLVISGTDANLILQDIVIPTWNDSTSTVKGTILVSHAATPESRWAEFQITGMTFHSTWFEFDVTPVQDVGTLFANNDPITVVFSRTGDKGTTGNTGGAGAAGPWGGAVTIPYHFSTTTTNSDPGSGNLRLDNATQDAAVTLRADVLDVNAASWENMLDAMDLPTHNPKGYLRLVRDADPTDWMLWGIAGVDSSSGYRNITIVLEEIGNQATSSPFVNGELVYLLYDRNGDNGAAGADGTTATSIVAYAERTTIMAGAITSATDITSVTVTFTAVAGRQYKITGRAGFTDTVTTDIVTLRITDGSNNQVQQADCTPTGSGTSGEGHAEAVITPGAGSKTYKLRMERAIGSGTVNHYATSTIPTFILVEDLTGGATTGEVTTASPLGAPGTPNLLRSYKGVMFMDTGFYWWPMGGAMEQIAYEWTHFFNNNAQKQELQSSASGTGAAANAGTAAAGAQGVLSLATGTTSTGRAGYAAGQSSALRGTADKLMHFHTRVRFPTLSTGSERYYFTAGYLSSMTGVPGDGFYFRYDDSVSADWYCVVVNNAAGTAGVSSGVAVATNTFQKLRIEIDEPGASAKFYIADALVQTITTNFPGSTRDFGPAINMRKTVGSTDRTCDVDYVGYWSLMTTTV